MGVVTCQIVWGDSIGLHNIVQTGGSWGIAGKLFNVSLPLSQVLSLIPPPTVHN